MIVRSEVKLIRHRFKLAASPQGARQVNAEVGLVRRQSRICMIRADTIHREESSHD